MMRYLANLPCLSIRLNRSWRGFSMNFRDARNLVLARERAWRHSWGFTGRFKPDSTAISTPHAVPRSPVRLTPATPHDSGFW